jgi:putative tryptophan/tyrosine transport system substrate-binding protein
MAGKWVELLKEIAPRVTQAALLFNPPTAPYADVFLNPFKAAAASFGVEAIAAPVQDTLELEAVVAALARESIVWPDSFLNVHRAEVISLAARYRLPAVYALRFFPELGGLLSRLPLQTISTFTPWTPRSSAGTMDKVLLALSLCW